MERQCCFGRVVYAVQRALSEQFDQAAKALLGGRVVWGYRQDAIYRVSWDLRIVPTFVQMSGSRADLNADRKLCKSAGEGDGQTEFYMNFRRLRTFWAPVSSKQQAATNPYNLYT